ncbi:MAG TPA: DUF1801 domain-containing protein [Xanthomonadales bacterium]|nr:DUF1801 domain-containing protein [Xanthomonadales bacterium]
MAKLKTQKNTASVKEYLDAVDDEQQKKDCQEIGRMMQGITGKKPRMWGTSIVGFGSYHYRYASGREGDWPLCGFSPRKQAMSLYIMSGFGDYEELMARLGKHKTGKSCLYIKKLDDVDREVLKQVVSRSVKYMRETYECS